MNSATTITLKDLILSKYLVKNLKIKNNDRARILTANNLTRTVGRGMEYAESRVYQPGDDARHIDWRITARHGKTYTKLFHEEKGENNYIILDLSSSLYFGTQYYLKSVVAAKIASFLLWLGFYENNNIGGIVFNSEQIFCTPAKQTKNNLLALLNKIVQFHDPQSLFKNTSPEYNLFNVIKNNEYLFHRNSRIFIISDFLTTCDLLNHKLTHMNHKNIINLIKISDPIEQNELPSGKYNISNGQNNTTVYIDKNNQDLFKQFFNNKLINYNQLIKSNIKNIDIIATPNWHNLLFSYLT